MISRLLPLCLLALLPAAAMAETAGASYSDGLLHTLLGLDHLIAMIAVGLISSQLGRQAVWQVPLVFVLALVVGGYMGLTTEDSPARDGTLAMSEKVIMLSDLALALAIIWIPLASNGARYLGMTLVTAILISIFGYYHGFAHGGEIPDGALPTFYVLGFATTSIIMHMVGVGIGEAARIFPQPRVARGVFAAVLLGISIPYQIRFWGDDLPWFLAPDTLQYIFG